MTKWAVIPHSSTSRPRRVTRSMTPPRSPQVSAIHWRLNPGPEVRGLDHLQGPWPPVPRKWIADTCGLRGSSHRSILTPRGRLVDQCRMTAHFVTDHQRAVPANGRSGRHPLYGRSGNRPPELGRKRERRASLEACENSGSQYPKWAINSGPMLRCLPAGNAFHHGDIVEYFGLWKLAD